MAISLFQVKKLSPGTELRTYYGRRFFYFSHREYDVEGFGKKFSVYGMIYDRGGDGEWSPYTIMPHDLNLISQLPDCDHCKDSGFERDGITRCKCVRRWDNH